MKSQTPDEIARRRFVSFRVAVEPHDLFNDQLNLQVTQNGRDWQMISFLPGEARMVIVALATYMSRQKDIT